MTRNVEMEPGFAARKLPLMFVAACALGLGGCVVRSAQPEYYPPPPEAPPPGVEAEVSVAQPPPAPVVEYPSPAPGPGYVWVRGYWDWSGYDWFWVSGYWLRP